MGFGSFFKKIAKIAIPAALSYFTGGTSSALLSVGMSAASGGLKSAPKSNPYTGMTAGATVDQSSTENADEIEKKKRLALNAAGSSGTTTSPLGVTTPATVTKRNLLGL